MNHDDKNEILYHTQGMSIPNFYAFDKIPPPKLHNAISSYAPVRSGETVIFLYDDTMFGSAKDGFLLTTERLYHKNICTQGVSIDIDDITHMCIRCGLLAKLSVGTDTVIVDIEITHLTNKNMRNFLLHIMDKTLGVLTSNTLGATNNADISSEQVVVCQGCGARYRRNRRRCEYCESPL
jgi:hypothetical protein